MSKSPEVVRVEPIPVDITFESLVWDGSNTVKVLKFLGEEWRLVPEVTARDVSGRTWDVPKHLEHRDGYQRAFVGDVLLKDSNGATFAQTPDQFKELYREVKK